MGQGPRPWEGGEISGERSVVVGDVTFRLGQTVLLRLEQGGTAHDGMLDGRTATVERLLVDYDDGIHVAVTIDDDPGQELMRDTGRYHFFFLGELEVCPT